MLRYTVKRNQQLRAARKRVFRELEGLRSGRSDALAKRMLEAVAEKERKQNQRQFSTEGSDTGQKWAPLSPAYLAYKLRKVGRKKILVWDGTLRDSLRHGSHGRRVERVARRGGRVVLLFGTRSRVAHYHQEGTNKMPARPPLRKTKKQVVQLYEVLAREILRRIDEITGGKLLSRSARVQAAVLGRDVPPVMVPRAGQ